MMSTHYTSKLAAFRSHLWFIAVLAAVGGAQAQGTDVSGPIENETWALIGSPYNVVGNILVDGDPGLVIEPGVTVNFKGNYEFRITGVLTAAGTVQDTIYFNKDVTVSSWKGVVFEAGLSSNSQLKYCRIANTNNSGIRIIEAVPLIENCWIENCEGEIGGGIYISIYGLPGALLTLENCIINRCDAVDRAGGMVAYLGDASIRVNDTGIYSCKANPQYAERDSWAGGILVNVSEGNATLSGCTIGWNTTYSYDEVVFYTSNAVGRGGGVYLAAGELTLENCVIKKNRVWTKAKTSIPWDGVASATSKGAGIYTNGVLVLKNSIVTENRLYAESEASAARNIYIHGAGVHCDGGSTFIENCTIGGNYSEIAGYYGDGVYRQGGEATVINSIVWENDRPFAGGVNKTYSCVQYLSDPANNVIDDDPLLDADFMISPVSPCIDAGNPDSIYDDVCFPPSYGSVRNDMGSGGGGGACGFVDVLMGNIVVDPRPGNLIGSCLPTFVNADWTLTSTTGVDTSGSGFGFLEDFPVGEYTITWMNMDGWEAPAPSLVTSSLFAGDTLDFIGEYLNLTTLIVNCDPDSLNAPFTFQSIDDDCPVRSASGDTAVSLDREGNWVLTWEEIPDWQTPIPNPVYFNVDHGDTFYVSNTRIPVAVDNQIIIRFSLGQCAPNPFNPQTTIAFELPEAEAVSLRVFDVAGRLVKTLVNGDVCDQGRHEAVWQGTDNAGRQMSSGTYFYRLDAGEFQETKRMVFLK